MGNRMNSGDSLTEENLAENFINNLPPEMLLQIFELLPLQDFDSIPKVCRRWHEIINCQSLWKSRLLMKYRVLVVDSLSEEMPRYRREPAEIMYTPNEINCQVMCKIRQYPQTSLVPQAFLSKMNSSKQPIQIVLFGLGMESPRCSSKLAPHLLCGHNSTFRTRGMVPGGGLKITYKGKHLLHLMTLYTNIKSVRENVTSNSDDVDIFAKWRSTDNSSGLQRTIRDSIMSADAFVYVSDSAKAENEQDDQKWWHKCRECLQLALELAALSENSLYRRPLLVLSCVNEIEMACHSCAEVIDRLQLKQLERPWNVCNLDINSLKEIENGFNWLIYSTLMQWSATHPQAE